MYVRSHQQPPLYFLAPAGVTVTHVSTSAVSVATEASPDSPGVTVYRVLIETKSCNAPVTGSGPYSCTIAALPAGALHTAQAVACHATGDCSTSTSGQGYTLPDSKSSSISFGLVLGSQRVS